MFSPPEWLLIGAVAAVGVLHTIVPDHWVPITLIARQQNWTQGQTARAALTAGTGHVVSTLAIAAVVWLAGVAAARSLGHWVDTLASLALVGFGGWIALSAWRDTRHGSHGHGHAHTHGEHDHDPHQRQIVLKDGAVALSIHETGAPPRFRLTGEPALEAASAETLRPDGSRQTFAFVQRGGFWESSDEIPEPHEFGVSVRLEHAGHEHSLLTAFYEHDHEEHGRGTGAAARPGRRTALLLILGSSPMVEGIPAFFAASRYGPMLVGTMAAVFGATTIATYVVLTLASNAGLARLKLGPVERYGEVLSGAFIALVGLVFWIWPVL